MAQKYIGAPIRRKEDRRFLTGQGQFVDDVKLPNMLHAAIVRSPHAHARILSIDTSGAEAHPDVRGVMTADDLQPGPVVGTGITPGQNHPHNGMAPA